MVAPVRVRFSRRVGDACRQASANVRTDAWAEQEVGPVSRSKAWPDRELLAASRLEGVCPVCGCPIEGGGYGTGRIADGLFCSLDHLADYWYSSHHPGEDQGEERTHD